MANWYEEKYNKQAVYDALFRQLNKADLFKKIITVDGSDRFFELGHVKSKIDKLYDSVPSYLREKWNGNYVQDIRQSNGGDPMFTDILMDRIFNSFEEREQYSGGRYNSRIVKEGYEYAFELAEKIYSGEKTLNDEQLLDIFKNEFNLDGTYGDTMLQTFKKFQSIYNVARNAEYIHVPARQWFGFADSDKNRLKGIRNVVAFLDYCKQTNKNVAFSYSDVVLYSMLDDGESAFRRITGHNFESWQCLKDEEKTNVINFVNSLCYNEKVTYTERAEELWDQVRYGFGQFCNELKNSDSSELDQIKICNTHMKTTLVPIEAKMPKAKENIDEEVF